MKHRLAISLAIGLAAAELAPLVNDSIGEHPIDFMWSHHAANQWRAGADPYAYRVANAW